ncbi:MAG: hypothetical protein DRP55_03535 [Spirochaetes bacterium]|nr:MAG: hypothetical protein DRP55_03535 [Spirochaetota bacterium]
MSIKAINISKVYPLKTSITGMIKAVDNVSIDIYDGSKTVIFGPTGGGKTTLISILAGILKPDRGEIIYNGKLSSKLNQSKKAETIIRKFGYIPQRPILIKDLNVIENILLPHIFFRKKIGELKNRALKLLERLDLIDKINSLPYQLSGGEIKKLLFIRAIVKEPTYIFADEPISELDEDSTTKILEIMDEENKNGTTIIISSHRFIKFKGNVDVYKMSGGRIVEYKSEKL